MTPKIKRFLSLLTTFIFTVTQFGMSPEVGAAQPSSLQEVAIPSSGFQLNLPPDLGTIEALHSGTGLTLVHIQTAHGNYEAQKKIQAILHYLKDTYGFKLLLLEGSASKLNPDLLKFFPDRMDLNMKMAEELAKEALVKGDELFLLEEPEAQAYGIEDIPTYRRTREAFKVVVLQQEKTEKFLQDMNLQIERLTGPHLNKNLRSFIRRLEAFESKTLPFLDWLSELNTQAKRALDLDLTDPLNQLDWPMLLRIFKLKEFESKIDSDAFSRERKEFLKAIQRIPRETHVEIETLLSSPLSQNQLPDPETGLLFEQMVEALPENFFATTPGESAKHYGGNYDAYPNVKLFIGHLILRSEIKGERLIEEMNRLTDPISHKLAKTEEEKKILSLFKDYRLLKRFFALELTSEDYEEVLKRGESIRPENVAKRFLELNGIGRIKNLEFKHLDEISALFEKALQFYQGTKERDRWMLENIQARLEETGQDKAVVITGSFHAEPFQDYFQSQGYNYALITPKITSTEGREAYLQAALQNSFSSLSQSTMELPRRAEIHAVQEALGENLDWINERVRVIRQRILKQAKEPVREGPPTAFTARSEVRSTPDPLDERVARSAVWFFLRKGIYFKSDLEDVYQEIYLSFAEERQRKVLAQDTTELSEAELRKLALRAAGKFVANQSNMLIPLTQVGLIPCMAWVFSNWQGQAMFERQPWASCVG